MLRLEQVEVCYGETVILRDIDFQIDAGQVVSLIGRNGVGKTTLVKTIIGLLSPRKGKIFLDDRDVTETSPDERVRRGVAYVPQGREIFPRLTVEENLLLGLEGAREKKEIPERIFAMFPALKSMLHRQGGDLSGGQQQQLAIARALISRPRLILMDEPTEGIQPNIVAEIEDVIRSLKDQGDLSVLLVEQSLDFALNASDYFYVLEKGSVAVRGNSEQAEEERIRKHLVV